MRMNSLGFTFCILAGASSAALPLRALAACDARSRPDTAAPMELYTSEGCSTPSPADRQPGRLRQALDAAAEVVPPGAARRQLGPYRLERPLCPSIARVPEFSLCENPL